MTKKIFWQPLLLLMLVLSQPLLAQASLPACTAEIVDFDQDRTNDNDGATGIIDIDKDGDGLIEVCDLEGVSEMRYQLDGSGYKASADATKITHGCPPAGCRGYELMKDLDFNVAASYRTTSNQVTWTTGDGWSPIGSLSNPFSSVFEGNGFMIAHLYINRSNTFNVGLFSVSDTEQIQNIRLSDVNVKGQVSVGGLVGTNQGIIINSNVTGTVNSLSSAVGGLVGSNRRQIIYSFANVTVTQQAGNSAGGLVGVNRGTIRESSASGRIEGNNNAGGLAGNNEWGSIINSYATGMVSGDSRVGGLTGRNVGSIINSYATGMVAGNSDSGGLVGSDSDSSVTGRVSTSYWDASTSMQATSAGGSKKTTAELQSPTAPGTTPTEIYYGWSEDIWYFGGADDYPRLLFTGTDRDTDGDGVPNNDSVGNRVDIDQDGDGLIEIYDLEGLNEIRYSLDGSGYKASADATTITQGCPATGCRGYELVRSLSFTDDASYADPSNKAAWTVDDYEDDDDNGWQPISAHLIPFTATFEGNHYTIANLMINRPATNVVGLFGEVRESHIINFGLLNIDIRGGRATGGLVGSNFRGSITNSYATGDIEGDNQYIGGLVGLNRIGSIITNSYANVAVTAIALDVGGLVGRNAESIIISSYATGDVTAPLLPGIARIGGLVGGNDSNSHIINSYATGAVTGNNSVGGLAGGNARGSRITNSYATGTVTGRSDVGGLVGGNDSDSHIINSYATGAITGNSSVGGLAGVNRGTVENSYWDTITSGIETSAAGDGRTTAELKSPTAPGMTSTEIYYGWSADIWYFGGANDYPQLLFAVPDPDPDDDGVPNNDSAGNRSDIDQDGDGLIEIYDLEGLNEIRYSLDGSGYKASADATTNTLGCPESGCIGYELVKDLDFNDDASYRTTSNKVTWTVDDYEDDEDSGWQPIGTTSIPFTATFEGNHYTIANLMINRPATSSVGLFGSVREGHIINVGLLNIDIRGEGDTGGLAGVNNRGSITNSYATGAVKVSDGNQYIGGLVGHNQRGSSITNSYANVTVTVAATAEDVGGLVGFNSGSIIISSYATGDVTAPLRAGIARIGGLVGHNDSDSHIINSYATGAVTGNSSVGGLVGDNGRGSRITNSYATGAVNGNGDVGGLVGHNQGGSIITNSYATGAVTGSSDVGGLVGHNQIGSITNSYWDTKASGIETSAGGDGRTTAELQSPTAPGTTSTEIYYGWSSDIWDFGSTNTYPILRFASDSDSDSDLVRGAIEYPQLLFTVIDRDPDGDGVPNNDSAGNRSDIDQDGDGLIEIYDLEGLNEIRYSLDGSGYKASANATKITQGCPEAGCIGYELVKDLDFNVAASYRTISNQVTWTTGGGWSPIGSFSSVFEGNGFMIAHLYINRSNASVVGLFSMVAEAAQIQNIRLSEVNVRGQSHVGSLVGYNLGIISNINVTGTVHSVSARVGGLVGENRGPIISSFTNVTVTQQGDQLAGGLVGFHRGIIKESSASGRVEGITRVGGLVGGNTRPSIIHSYSIINSYATGMVSGDSHVGGLVGSNLGIISRSYATGMVAGNSDTGGLAGSNTSNHFIGTVTVSYWDTSTSMQETSAGGDGRTTAELQSPTAPGTTPTQIYYGWSEEAWYFGSTNTYPLLRLAVDSDGDLVNDAIDIDDDNDGLIEVHTIDDLHEIRFQHDGSAKRQHTDDHNNTSGCPSWGCRGYELVRSLDFNDANSYRNYEINSDWTVEDYSDDTDHGWHPLPGFRAVFNGNGFIISNLQINRVTHNNAGLFGAVHRLGRVENVELVYPNIRGGSNVGGLVGNNNGVVINSYVRDYDTDASTRDTSKYIEAISGSVGGLVGRNNGGGESIGDIINSGAVIDVQIKQDTSTAGINANAGGLAGFNLNGAEIINSYARGTVKGPCGVGGLIANNLSSDSSVPEKNSKIINSYATGNVITGFGNCNDPNNIRSGGLAAVNSGLISNSYTRSCFSSGSATVANTRRGGVVQNNSGTISNSYYQATGCNGLQQTPGGSNKTQTQLQAPVATDSNFSSGIYQAWALSEWDFGDNSQYPVIRYTPGPDKDNPGCGYRDLPECVALLKHQLPVGRTVTYADTSVTVDSPDSISSTVNSEVNGEPATFTGDGAILVKLGDTVQVNAAGSFVIKDGINIPLDYGWYISSGPTLFSNELRGESVSFDINDDLFRNSQSGDAVLTLALRDKYNPATTLATAQIPIRILGRLVLTSGYGEVMQDQMATTLHHVVWAVDQPQTVITARSLNQAITLTVDDSDEQVSAVNGDGTAIASNITVRLDAGARLEFTITATDSDNNVTTHTVRVFRRVLPIDDDNNGLIDIYTLEDLDEIRNQHVNMPSTCGINSDLACEGFELRRSLDFNVADSYEASTVNTEWTTGNGWLPIASRVSPFNRIFEGNGFTLLGLYIDRLDSFDLSLFAVLGTDGVVKNVGLLDVSVVGTDNIGGLVGLNDGAIINSHVTSANMGVDIATDVGGLVGYNRNGFIINSYVTTTTVLGGEDIGGLVGENDGSIISSFAYADVIGFERIGGLVGRNDNGIIENTYAAGTVASTQTVVSAGGLVGQSTSDSEIRNSYVVSQVMPLTDGSSRIGGLVSVTTGTIIASYWDKTVNADLTATDNAKTTAELQNPTMPGVTSADIYHGWRTEAWDFGDRGHYPTLYYATIDAITVSACADNPIPSSALPRCGSRIPNQAVRTLNSIPDLEVSEITMRSQPVANADGTINEGSNVRLMVNVTGGSESYSYAWSQISGKALVLTTTNTATLNVTIAPDLVELDATTAVVTFQVEVDDGVSTTSRRVIIIIKQIDNGNPVTEVDVNPARLRVITTTADADGTDSFSYQWQQLVFGGTWTNITDATTAAYWLPADVNARIQYRVEVTHTDSQGHTINYQQGPFRARLDDDNDGLIDIYTLEDLDDIRNQHISMPSTCGSNGDLACDGFELRRSLDFSTVESYQSGMTDPNWTTSTGWLPIGSMVSNRFNRVFEGNGYTLSGLYIDREQSHQGLFAELGADGEIKNVGLLDVAVHGSWNVGSLIGENHGRIVNSYATGAVFGGSFNVGGLVGDNGYTGSILASFVNVNVSGISEVGGLVGAHIGRITNSYAAGTVSSIGILDVSLGGLVGWVGQNDGEIINSYAISHVIPAANNARLAGGLVGVTTGTVIASYWNTETSGQQSSAGGDGAIAKTIAELQSPTAAGATPADSYYGWSDTVWEFGHSQDYPVLRYVGGGLNACRTEEMSTASDLPQCGSLLPNQGRTERFVLTVSEVMISSQPPVNNDDTINEGSDVSLMVNATGGREVYHYAWSQTSGEALVLTTTDTATLNVAIAPDFIAEDATTTTLTFVVMVTDGFATTRRSTVMIIKKIDNGSLGGVNVDMTPARLRIISTEADPDGSEVFSYQWQQQELGGPWEDIPDATTTTYWLPADVSASVRYRVTISYIDGQGYSTEYQSEPFRGRLDDDNDGLIDIYTLEDLDDIRNQYANMPSTCAVGNVEQCRGFELRRSLDFNAADSYEANTVNTEWTTGDGWLPIGGTFFNSFNRIFEGNGYTLSGLYIDREQSHQGLFTALGADGEIKNVGLLDVAVETRGTWVGGLVGLNYGDIINSYVTGVVTGHNNIGGLVGSNFKDITNSNAVVTVSGNNGVGGLVGENDDASNIINSYASGAVSGNWYVGGLVGENDDDSNIINSYASGAVSGVHRVGGLVGWHQGRLRNAYATGDVLLTSTSDNSLGGLIGYWGGGNSISNSYAIGRVIPGVANARNAGGLIGTTTGTAISSYWNVETSGWFMSAGGVTSETTVELQSPLAPGTTATDVYYGWSEHDWDFGSRTQYPALRYVAASLNACNADISTASALPQCGSLLPNRERGALEVSEVMISSQPPVNNDDTINEGSNVRLMVNTIGGSGVNHWHWSQTSGKALVLTTTDTATLNVAIPSDLIAEDATTTALTFTVIVDDGISTISRSKMITITKVPLAISGVMLSTATIVEGSIATVTFDVSGGTGIYQYAYKLIAGADEIPLPSLPPPIDLLMPSDIVAAADSERMVELNIIVSDDSGRSDEHNEVLTIEKVDNGLANIAASRITSRTVAVTVGSDPDGDATTPTYAYQWEWRAAATTAQWVTIAGAEAALYTISDDLAVVNNEFRVRVIYTDGQGYRNADGFYSNAVRYDFLPSCTMAIEDSDGDDADGTVDIDKDGDGLIELCDLEGINGMRYQLDGSGYKTSEDGTISRRGCPLIDGEEQCRGYELVRSLDFNVADSYRANTTSSEWTAGGGWLPITAGFASVFEGNGHSIANLYIKRTEAASGSEQGLFSTLATTAQINNMRLLDVNIQGFAQVAALSGRNSGIIRDSFASGVVMANTDVGGLVGRNDGSVMSSDAHVEVSANMNGGGLVGRNDGSVMSSDANAEVSAIMNGGGLVGRNDGSVVSSDAHAEVSANMNGGGLVGHNQGSLSDSHTGGRVKGGSRLGGLSGFNNGSIMSSYTTATVIGSDTSSHTTATVIGSDTSSDTTATVSGTDSGSHDIGGLVGHNQGSVSDSHADGEVMGGSRLGGLSGFNSGSIISSYATATVNGSDTSSDDIGGLVGRNDNVITNSYATGGVSATGNNIGGLVGFNKGEIANTYAEGTVMGGSQVGGLIGRHYGSLRDSYVARGAVSGSDNGSDIGGLIGIMNTTATVTASYWDSDTSEQVSSAGGDAKTTAELQTAIAAGTTTADVYYNWSHNDWDFGDNHHYPALRYASDDDLNRCVIDITTSTTALPCALLPGQHDRDKGLATIFFFSDDLATAVTPTPLFSPLTDNYTITIVTLAEQLRFTLRPYAINANATIAVTDSTDKSYFADKPTGALSDEIVLEDEIILSIVVTDTRDGDTVHTTYTFTITSELPPLIVSDIKLSSQPPANSDGTINEGSMATLTFNVSGGSGVYQYEAKIDDASYTPFEPPFMYSIADDFVAANALSQTVELTIRVSDQSDKGEVFEHTEELSILKTDQGTADINLSINNETLTLTVTIGADPDGAAAAPSYQYKWQSQAIEAASAWTDIADATGVSYTISGDLAATSNRFRVQVTYTDGQGYRETLTSNAIGYTPPDRGIRVRTKVFLEGPLR